MVKCTEDEACSVDEPMKKRLKTDAEVAKKSPASHNDGAMSTEKKDNWTFMMGKKPSTVSPGKSKRKSEEIKIVCDDKLKHIKMGSNFSNVPKRPTQCFNESKEDTSKTSISIEDSPLKIHSNVPLAERMRPLTLGDYIGQEQAIGRKKLLRSLFEANKIPSMILWGPPGCGKVKTIKPYERRVLI